MMGRFVAAALFMIAASTASANAVASPCTELDGHVDKLRELYSYALFVEAVDSGKLPPWRCEAAEAERAELTRKPPGWNTAVPEFQRLTSAELQEYGWSEIAESFRDQGRHIGAYVSRDGGPVYVVCDDNPQNIKLFLTWSRFRANIDDDGLLSRIVVPVVLAIDFVEAATTQEGLRMMTFHRDDVLSEGEEQYYPDTVTAIPGTDFLKLRESKTSWNDLDGGSCIFEFMVRFADRAWSSTDGLYALAGHSLGGSVTQYVTQKLATAKEENGDGSASRANFQAYAFNAIGLDESRGVNPETLHSFYIEGDPVVGLGAYRGRIQGGQVVRYTPPPTTSVRSKLKNLWEEATFKWHRLWAVQEGLCDCMNGRGDLSITDWSVTRGN